ncbi:MFS transporter [Nocardiopsis dassonvillei]|uniref:MFS transporter n=1 Tax=Nocardiopsis dassonvillei TaxID=2014 RepID=UPI0008FC8E9F|nr:MFS transporter [Nocardiopsis dassonvillei]APC35864.1 MFS transporter [Nocardiopsis dassonvillei]
MGAAFWNLWTSSALSNLADGVLKTALPLVALRFTDSPVLIAGVTFALTLPWLFFALPAGALADRLDRRRTMLGANLARALLLGVLALSLALDLGSVGLLYAVALCVGVTETLYDTSAQSILPQVVGRDRLPRANGRLHAAELTANQFLGPPLGGLLVAAGAAAAFTAPAALWLVAVGALLLVRGRFRTARTASATLRADIAEGLRFLWRDRILRSFAAMVGASNFASNAAFTVFVLFAVGPDSPMGLSEPAYGLLMTAVAAGSVVGALCAGRIERLLGRTRALRTCALTFAVLVGLPAVTADPVLVAAGFFAGGVGIAVWNVVTVSLRQRITPDPLLGRVNSAYRLLAWGTMPLGAATGGLIAEFLGLTWVFASMGLLCLGLLAGLARLDDAALTAAEHRADESRQAHGDR